MKTFQLEYDEQNKAIEAPKPKPFVLTSENKGPFPLHKPASSTPSGSNTPTIPAPPRTTSQGEDDDQMPMESLSLIYRPVGGGGAGGSGGGTGDGEEAPKTQDANPEKHSKPVVEDPATVATAIGKDPASSASEAGKTMTGPEAQIQ